MANGVLLLTGPPGSGKTTTARLIATAAALGAHVEADSFFHFVHGGYLEPWLPESHPQNVIDGIISPKWFLAPLSEALLARGHAVSYVILRPPVATCIARADGRAGDALSNPDVITQLWNDFADIDAAFERRVIEVDDVEPDTVARTVTSRWRATMVRI